MGECPTGLSADGIVLLPLSIIFFSSEATHRQTRATTRREKRTEADTYYSQVLFIKDGK